MKNKIVKFGAITMIAVSLQSVAQTVNYVETISQSEFLKLPDGIQALYIGGLIDGMTYTSYNYSLSHHDQIVRCVRTITLGELAKKTVDTIRVTVRKDEPMPSAVARTIGLYCKEKGFR